MTTLIIARHGNTFESNEIPRRIGIKTDLPLVSSGKEQAKSIGRYLRSHKLLPDVVYASALQRAQETAKIAIKESGITNPIFTLDIFNEIDHGIDENKTDEEIIKRIGKDALDHWNKKALVPEGWNAYPENIIKNWKGFANQISAHDDNEVILVVTSAGIARFAPHITGNFDDFLKNHSPKLATGSLSIFKFYQQKWIVTAWNITP